MPMQLPASRLFDPQRVENKRVAFRRAADSQYTSAPCGALRRCLQRSQLRLFFKERSIEPQDVMSEVVDIVGVWNRG
jgi:hypothetical protein